MRAVNATVIYENPLFLIAHGRFPHPKEATREVVAALCVVLVFEDGVRAVLCRVGIMRVRQRIITKEEPRRTREAIREATDCVWRLPSTHRGIVGTCQAHDINRDRGVGYIVRQKCLRADRAVFPDVAEEDAPIEQITVIDRE